MQLGVTNEAIGGSNQCKKVVGKTRFVRKISKTSYRNLLGALFWRLPMVRKDALSGDKPTTMIVRR